MSFRCKQRSHRAASDTAITSVRCKKHSHGAVLQLPSCSPVLQLLCSSPALVVQLRKKEKSARQKLLDEMSKNIANAYNIGDGAQETGVAFDDVQARLAACAFCSVLTDLPAPRSMTCRRALLLVLVLLLSHLFRRLPSIMAGAQAVQGIDHIKDDILEVLISFRYKRHSR